MRMNKFFAFIAGFICIFAVTVSAYASESRASDQIASYGMNVTPLKGMLDVKFSVTASGPANKVGCQSIYIYEKSGSEWSYVDSKTEDDSGMSRTDYHAHKNNIDFESEAGTEYKVVVTIFAENDKGRDTRTKVFLVTGR